MVTAPFTYPNCGQEDCEVIELLHEHSEYFKRALNGSWKEAEDKVVCLDDVDCGSCEYTAKFHK